MKARKYVLKEEQTRSDEEGSGDDDNDSLEIPLWSWLVLMIAYDFFL